MTRPPRPVHRMGGWARIKVGVAGCILVGAVLSGCTSARSSLGTSDASCYLALPTATKAVGSDGRLIGIDLFTATDLSKIAPHLYRLISAHQTLPRQVCVAAFVGSFTRAGVSKPLGRMAGPLAVVVSTTTGNTLLGTVLFSHAPLHFGHTHFA